MFEDFFTVNLDHITIVIKTVHLEVAVFHIVLEAKFVGNFRADFDQFIVNAVEISFLAFKESGCSSRSSLADITVG
jgi:hypothetical protein